MNARYRRYLGRTLYALGGLAVLLALVSIGSLIVAEVRARSVVSSVKIGMTEDEVIAVCGPPTATGIWWGSCGEGRSFTYTFPHWWDYLVWWHDGCPRSDTGSPYIREVKQCQITFRGEQGQSRALEVTRRAAGSKHSLVVKSR